MLPYKHALWLLGCDEGVPCKRQVLSSCGASASPICGVIAGRCRSLVDVDMHAVHVHLVVAPPDLVYTIWLAKAFVFVAWYP